MLSLTPSSPSAAATQHHSKLGPLQVLSAKLGPVRTPMEAAKAAKESGLTVDAYLGGWTDDTRSGLGRLTTSAGEIYEGEWSGGRRHGRGLCYYPNGQCYVGEWVDGVRQGTGSLTMKPK